MSEAVAAAALLTVLAAVQIAVPGSPVYHSGWFNVAVAAVLAVCIGAVRRALGQSLPRRLRWALISLLSAGILAGGATIVSGLFLPDNRTIVSAPDTRIPIEGLNATLAFPSGALTQSSVTLERSGRAPLSVGSRGRSVGSSVVWIEQRLVVHVEARDARGGRLTVTQPAGTSFLSPVLLMLQHQTIAGLDLPFDSFAVPAARRTVKAVLFTAAQASKMHGVSDGSARPAVLFAVDDQDDRPLPHAIAMARDGETVDVGGLALHADVFAYPSVEIASAPPLSVVVIASILVVAGLAAAYGNGVARFPNNS